MDKKLLLAKPIAEELDKFNAYYLESINSDNVRIQEKVDYVLRTDGKRIRPILLLLAAKACGTINEATYNSAVTIELLHTASLIHDDIVDESEIRRGKASLNAVYDNKIAVLVGDYFLSTALIKSVYSGNLEIIADISNLGRSLAKGELNQLSLVKELILDEKEYLDVIKNKTASLLSTCMKIGVLSVDGRKEEVEKYTALGEMLGMCFQLRDDIFDYYSTDVGKPTGNDIREGKITLPLLYAIAKAEGEEKTALLKVISDRDYSSENVHKLISYAIEKGGIEYTYQKIEEYKLKAEKIVDTIEDAEMNEAFHNAIDYIVNRNY